MKCFLLYIGFLIVGTFFWVFTMTYVNKELKVVSSLNNSNYDSLKTQINESRNREDMLDRAVQSVQYEADSLADYIRNSVDK